MNSRKRNNGKSIKKTKLKKHTKKPIRTRKHKKGGKFLGRGAYGSVYSEPRILCKDEELSDIMDKDEASKVFKSLEEFDKDRKVLSKLTTYLGAEIEDFKKYAIIPHKVCDTKPDILNTPPYNSQKWYGDENPASYDYYTEVISISKEGGKSLYNINKYFEDTKTEPVLVIKYLNNLINVGKGIHILLKHDLVHGDIKPSNIILDKKNQLGDMNPYIIDVGDIEKVENKRDDGSTEIFYEPLLYVYRPPTVIYTSLLDSELERPIYSYITEKKPDYGLTTNSDLRFLSLITTFLNNQEFFNSNSFDHINSIFDVQDLLPRFITFVKGKKQGKLLFSTETDDYIRKLIDILKGQKLYNIFIKMDDNSNINVLKSSPKYGEFKVKMIDTYRNELQLSKLRASGAEAIPRDPSHVEYVNTLNYFTSLTGKYKTKREMIQNTFHRIDIYSFGITLLEGLTAFLHSIAKHTKPLSVDKKMTTYLLKLFTIVFLCCNVLPEENSDMSDKLSNILNLYQKTINDEPFDAGFKLSYYNPSLDKIVSMTPPKYIF